MSDYPAARTVIGFPWYLPNEVKEDMIDLINEVVGCPTFRYVDAGADACSDREMVLHFGLGSAPCTHLDYELVRETGEGSNQFVCVEIHFYAAKHGEIKGINDLARAIGIPFGFDKMSCVTYKPSGYVSNAGAGAEDVSVTFSSAEERIFDSDKVVDIIHAAVLSEE